METRLAKRAWGALVLACTASLAGGSCRKPGTADGVAPDPTSAARVESGTPRGEPRAPVVDGVEADAGHADGLRAVAAGTEDGGASAPAPGTYSASIDTRGGGCCSQSCGAHSTLASFTLTIAADGSAGARWERTGCLVTLSGEGHLMMPFDPGPPEQLCRQDVNEGPGVRREMTPLAGGGQLQGRWTSEGGWLDLALEPSGPGEPIHLRCTRREPAEPGAQPPKPLVGCRFVDPDPLMEIGLVVGSGAVERLLYLDDVPGFAVHATHGGFGDPERVELVPGPGP